VVGLHIDGAAVFRGNDVMPSFGGHGNGQAMARVFAMLAMDGTLDGVSILSPGGAERKRSLAWECD
jgi:hypothetical protein